MLPKKNQEKVNLTIESIEKLQQELGEWHDIHTAVHFVTGELVPKKAVEHVLKLKEDETRHFNALYSTLAPSHLSLVHSPYPR
jgi:CHAD domain-containing protein